MTRFLQTALATLVVLGATLSAALAGETEATIVDIKPDTSSLVLSNGASYLIPVDFFIDDLKPGMKVLVFFDEDSGGRTLTDVQILDN
jgi:hypothetical protein